MKYVPFRECVGLNARQLFATCLENAADGMKGPVIIKRSIVANKLEAAKEAQGVELEDEHWTILCQAFDALPFKQMSRSAMEEFVSIRKDLLEAKEPKADVAPQ